MISRTIRVLLVGGIGSGKSTLAGFLRERGARVIDADLIGHEVLESEARGAVAERWPGVVRGGRIDRPALAEIVFADVEQLRELERLTHPHIAARIQAQVNGAPEELVVVELPVSGELLGEGWITVLVRADRETRIRRLVAKDMTEEAVEARMGVQPDEAEWERHADIVFDNDGPLREEDVDGLMDQLRSLAES